MSKHTSGPWKWAEYRSLGFHELTASNGRKVICDGSACGEYSPSIDVDGPDARLIAAAPELLEALQEAVDMAWIEDSHEVLFDSTVMFGPGYDFSGLDGFGRQEFLGAVECVVWPNGGSGPRRWSAYCTHDGSLWFEKFDSAAAAKEACMRLLDRVLPGHPAMKARAAIAKATGENSD